MDVPDTNTDIFQTCTNIIFATQHYLSPKFTLLYIVSTPLNLEQFQCNIKSWIPHCTEFC